MSAVKTSINPHPPQLPQNTTALRAAETTVALADTDFPDPQRDSLAKTPRAPCSSGEGLCCS